MTKPILPISAWAPVTTRRLRNPWVLWTSPEAEGAGFDPDQVYCCPKEDEAPDCYTEETRDERADRYGGIGVGTAGGSGRCSSFNGLQTKGVGVTPLVGPDADIHHSSGTITLASAIAEALFGEVYRIALPYGGVPVHAVVALNAPNADGQHLADARALAIRPFVTRPAHFLRNLLHPTGRRAAGPTAPGLTHDADRVRCSMALLATNLRQDLALDVPSDDEVQIINAGLRELARRLAAQFAAGFAKRLPHGSMSCSNFALSGAYLDYGLSSFVPAYRRIVWANGQDSWAESSSVVKTLVTLRQQIDSHRPELRGSAVIAAHDIAALFWTKFQERLAMEMSKMAGLTEDLADACPPELLVAWLAAMRDIWSRGATERFMVSPGAMVDGSPSPAPRYAGRYDLNEILSVAGPHHDALDMDRALISRLDDPALRARFVRSAVAVRAALRAKLGVQERQLDTYLGMQAGRKNALLDGLQRDTWFRTTALRTLEPAASIEQIRSVMNRTLTQAQRVLADLHPELPGTSGIAQLRAL